MSRTAPAYPEMVISTYRKVADAYARARSQSLFEMPMLSTLDRAAPGRELLDLGCGTGAPLAAWLSWRGFRVTGVDSAPAMLAHFRRNVPGGRAICADMRALALRQRFDAVLAWDSFFHLSHRDQMRMIPRFAGLLRPKGVLIFSSGPCHGLAYGHAAGAPIFHASHGPLTYRRLLRSAGFEVLRFAPQDPSVDCHSWWVARCV